MSEGQSADLTISESVLVVSVVSSLVESLENVIFDCFFVDMPETINIVKLCIKKSA